MREFITAEDICNQISMNRSLFKGTIVLTEGNTDKRLYGKFIDQKEARIIPALSKNNAKKALSIMQKRGDQTIMAILDRDLDDLFGKTVKEPMFYTDLRDMEMIVITTDALDSVLDEYADEEKLTLYTDLYGPVLDNVLEGAYHLGCLMYVSVRNGYNLNFKDYRMSDIVDRRTMAVDVRKMIDVVIGATANCRVSPKLLLRQLESAEDEITDRLHMSRGHDSVRILQVGLNSIFGSYNARSLTEGALSGSLRIAYSRESFESTDLYRNTSKWAESKGLRVWKFSSHPYPRS